MNMEPMKMDVVLLLLLTASGLCVVSARVERQYHFVNETMNWTEAQRYCREKFTDLATIDSMEDVNILFNVEEFYRFISKYPRIIVWIGLHDDLDSWMWSLLDTSFYKHGETEFRRWKPGEPKKVSNRKHCTTMSDGSWYDNGCGANAKAVCMDVRGLNVTFVLIDYYLNWTEAQNYCRKHHTDLASVRNMTENQRVKELVPTGQHAWIGLSRDAWRWSDGSSYSFTYWQPAEPDNKNGDEFCVAIKPVNSLRWSDWSCDRKLTFLCYSQVTKKQVIKVRLQRKDSSLDLNDPAVLEQMLKQLQQKLKDQGLKDDVKLSWRKQAGGKVFHREKETKQRKTRATEDEL